VQNVVVTAKDLRDSAGRIIRLVDGGREVTVTYRGKAAAKIIPIRAEVGDASGMIGAAFGMWADHADARDVESYVRDMREGRGYAY